MSTLAPLLLHAFPTFAMGGAQSRFVQLANAFGASFRHLIVSLDGVWDAADGIGPEVPWSRLAVDVKRGRGLANRAAFRAVLRERRPNLLLTYNWGAIEWAAANLPRLVPHIHAEDGFGVAEARQQQARRVWARRLLLGLPAVPLFVPSATLRAVAGGWWVPPHRILHVSNGVRVAPDAAPRLPPASGPIVIGTVASLRPEKNIGRLLRAVAAQQNAHSLRLLVVGGGAEAQRLRALAAELDIVPQVEFTGPLADPRQALRRMHLFALSSDTEQLPLSLLEAMAEGLPAIATRVGDVADAMPPGFPEALCEADDAAFASLLGQALQRRERWAAQAEAGLLHVRARFDFDAMLLRWAAMFRGDLARTREVAE